MISTGNSKITELKLHREYKDNPKEKRRRKGGKWPFLLFAAFIAYFTISLGGQFNRLHAMQKNMDSLQSQVEELKSRNANLREEIKQIKSDSYIEQVAREQLGLVKPGETLVVPSQSPTQPSKEKVANQPEVSKTSNGNKTGQTFNVKYKNIYD